jgi:hypothetical protein
VGGAVIGGTVALVSRFTGALGFRCLGAGFDSGGDSFFSSSTAGGFSCSTGASTAAGGSAAGGSDYTFS